MYKLIARAGGSNDLSIGFDRDRVRKQRALTNNENEKGNYHVWVMLKHVFGSAEHQKNVHAAFDIK